MNPISPSERYKVIPRTLIFLFNNNKVLLIKQNEKEKIGFGRWNGVGGHVEKGEKHDGHEKEAKNQGQHGNPAQTQKHQSHEHDIAQGIDPQHPVRGCKSQDRAARESADCPPQVVESLLARGPPRERQPDGRNLPAGGSDRVDRASRGRGGRRDSGR